MVGFDDFTRHHIGELYSSCCLWCVVCIFKFAVKSSFNGRFVYSFVFS